jgi:hypothetical protein
MKGRPPLGWPILFLSRPVFENACRIHLRNSQFCSISNNPCPRYGRGGPSLGVIEGGRRMPTRCCASLLARPQGPG